MNFKKLLMIALFSFGLVNSTFAKVSKDTLEAKMLQALEYIDKGNFEKASLSLKEAAENGYFPAQATLADMYYEGLGITKNIQKAVYWYQKAAEHKYIGRNSALVLGKIYYNGDVGGKPDFKKAKYYFKLAACDKFEDEDCELYKKLTQ